MTAAEKLKREVEKLPANVSYAARARLLEVATEYGCELAESARLKHAHGG